ncbi:hypothetical protein [Kitasatospora cheerisanensis]|uniref:hypothetical protein n=1 Tax=Kitasatospora cheerisanensis TaxID=81942 RepID=UPI003CC5282E
MPLLPRELRTETDRPEEVREERSERERPEEVRAGPDHAEVDAGAETGAETAAEAEVTGSAASPQSSQ